MAREKTPKVQRILALAKELELAHKRIDRNRAANSEAAAERRTMLDRFAEMFGKHDINNDTLIELARRLYLSDQRVHNTGLRKRLAEISVDATIDSLDRS